MRPLSRRLEQAATTVKALEKEQYPRQFTRGQLDCHVRLSWSGILEPVAPEVMARFREEEQQASQEQAERIAAGIGAALDAEHRNITDAEVSALVCYFPWRYFLQPGVRQTFGMPGGEEILLAETHRMRGLEDLTLETVWPELEAGAGAAWEGSYERAAMRLGVPVADVC
ncbi:MAG TPA: hypothetical protein VK689_01405 [Armatimonadota bacterium]|nr:hypothetical protein [Armatimonadota bacterium]